MNGLNPRNPVNQAEYQARETMVRALAILNDHPTLMALASANNLSIPLTRLYFEKVAAGAAPPNVPVFIPPLSNLSPPFVSAASAQPMYHANANATPNAHATATATGHHAPSGANTAHSAPLAAPAQAPAAADAAGVGSSASGNP